MDCTLRVGLGPTLARLCSGHISHTMSGTCSISIVSCHFPVASVTCVWSTPYTPGEVYYIIKSSSGNEGIPLLHVIILYVCIGTAGSQATLLWKTPSILCKGFTREPLKTHQNFQVNQLAEAHIPHNTFSSCNLIHYLIGSSGERYSVRILNTLGEYLLRTLSKQTEFNAPRAVGAPYLIMTRRMRGE